MSSSYRVTIPAVLTPNSFEVFLDQIPLPEALDEATVIIDCSLLSSLSVFGALHILALCLYLQRLGAVMTFDNGQNNEVNAFFQAWGIDKHADGFPGSFNGSLAVFQAGSDEEVLLPVTAIETAQDIYTVIDAVRDKLALPSEQTNDLVVVISEIAQNIIEHSRSRGFIALGKGQVRIKGRKTLDICVGDTGIGIGQSLENKLRQYEKDSLDRVALYKTLFEGVSRYDDPGRGNGIVKTRGIVERHKGKLMLRSGRAKLWGSIASWQIERFMRKQLRFFPGTQVTIHFPV